MFESAEAVPILPAVASALGGTFDDAWPKFAAYNWNIEPLRLHFIWDRMTVAVADEIELESVSVSGTQSEYEMKLEFPEGEDPVVQVPGVNYLSSHYFHFDLTDSSAHNILFANGFSFELREGAPEAAPADVTLYANRLSAEEADGAHVQLLVKADGQRLPDPIDVTDVAFIPFCQDYEQERIEELVVIFSNSPSHG